MIPRLKRVLIGVIAGTLVLAGGVWLLIRSLGDTEYLYQGKPVFYWQDHIRSPDAAVSNQTRLVIQQEIIPRLTDVMFHDVRDSKLKLALIEQLNSLPGVSIFYIPADGRRAQAASGLGSLGPYSESAIPELIKVVKSKDEAVRIAALSALGQLKSQPDTVIPLLTACLDDPQDGMAEAAVEGLGNFGPLSRSAWPKLVPLLKIRDKDLQRALGIALKQIDPEEAAKLRGKQ